MRSGWSARDVNGRYIVAVSGGGMAFSDRGRTELVDLVVNADGRVLAVVEADGLLWFPAAASVELQRVGDYCGFGIDFPKGDAPAPAPLIRLKARPGGLGNEIDSGSGGLGVKMALTSSASGHGAGYAADVGEIADYIGVTTYAADSYQIHALKWFEGYPLLEIMRGVDGMHGQIPRLRVEDTVQAIGEDIEASWGFGHGSDVYTHMGGFYFYFRPRGEISARAGYTKSGRVYVMRENRPLGITMDRKYRLGIEFGPAERGGLVRWLVDGEEAFRLEGTIDDWGEDVPNTVYCPAVMRIKRLETSGSGRLYGLMGGGLCVYMDQ